MRAFGSLHLSTSAYEYGIEAQRQAITGAGCATWLEVEWVEDHGRSGKDINGPGIMAARAQVKAGHPEALGVSRD